MKYLLFAVSFFLMSCGNSATRHYSVHTQYPNARIYPIDDGNTNINMFLVISNDTVRIVSCRNALDDKITDSVVYFVK